MALPSKIPSRPQPPKSAPKPTPSSKDFSWFQGKPHIERQKVRAQLGKDDLYSISRGMPKGARIAFETKVFPKGRYATKKDAEKALKTLKYYPEKSKKEFGIKNDFERRQALNVVKKILGK